MRSSGEHGLALLDEARSGAENMALDEQMLARAAAEGVILLRVYRWARPTLSLGYFQRASDRQQVPEAESIDIVRRSTGGGAIVHHHDWTYSLAVPALSVGSKANSSDGQPPDRQRSKKGAARTEGQAVGVGQKGDLALEGPSPPTKKLTAIGASQDLYDIVHRAIVRWLNDCGLNSRQVQASEVSSRNNRQFLCFERRTAGDVVSRGCKIMGSAQRRSRGSLLQHGSLLLSRSRHAPSLPGIAELRASQDPASQGASAHFQQADHKLQLSDFFSVLTGSLEEHAGMTLGVRSCVEELGLHPSDLREYDHRCWTYRQ